ncbi:MAG: hydrogenase formation protein HypD [Planctomycetota bacterium]|jgi:hydrogenase expression/formation protein HypD
MNIEPVIDNIKSMSEEAGRPLVFMEVCGTHTVSAFRTGLRSLLPDNVNLLSGPGCPVCVTPVGYIDHAIEISRQPNSVIVTFGDMLRVPGSKSSLEREKATGADVRMVYSPMDALNMAKDETDKNIVFLGVGFETTTPTIAWTIKEAAEKDIENYFVLSAHKTIPEAMTLLVTSGEVKLDGYMCPGHVSVITGSKMYEPICEAGKIPCVVTGFEAIDMAKGIEMLVKQVIENRANVEVEYSRSVTADGNAEAQKLCSEVFDKCDTEWRGFGVIPDSGLDIAEKYKAIDAAVKFADVEIPEPVRHTGCSCGEVLKGLCIPTDCKLFGNVCTPSNPVGACMVSSEGACAAFYKYGR